MQGILRFCSPGLLIRPWLLQTGTRPRSYAITEHPKRRHLFLHSLIEMSLTAA